MFKYFNILTLIVLALFISACDDEDGSSGDEMSAGESMMMAGDMMSGGAEMVGGEAMTGGDTMAAGETMDDIATPEGNINELADDQRDAFCQARLATITSTIDFESELFQQTTEKTCLLGGLLEGMDEASCEMIVAECRAEAMIGFNPEAFVADCLANEDLFSTCASPVGEYLDCESALATHSINAFSMVDFGTATCANAGDFAALSGLFGQLQSVIPPEDLCTPAASMCVNAEEEGEMGQ